MHNVLENIIYLIKTTVFTTSFTKIDTSNWILIYITLVNMFHSITSSPDVIEEDMDQKSLIFIIKHITTQLTSCSNR